MLKSELVISSDLERLDRYLKYYNNRYITNTFSDENGQITEIYKSRHAELIKLITNDKAREARDKFITIISEEEEIIIRIESIFEKIVLNESNIDPKLINTIKKHIKTIKDNIRNCYIKLYVNIHIIDDFFLVSLNLVAYFTALRSSIFTIRSIKKRFYHNNVCCILKFMHTKDASFTIIQQNEIINFTQKILSNFFGDHLDIIKIEFDTGSPIVEIIIKFIFEKLINIPKINEILEIIRKHFRNFFINIVKKEKAGDAIEEAKEINNIISDLIIKYQNQDKKQLDKMKIEIGTVKYAERAVEILDSYHELRNNHIKITMTNLLQKAPPQTSKKEESEKNSLSKGLSTLPKTPAQIEYNQKGNVYSPRRKRGVVDCPVKKKPKKPQP